MDEGDERDDESRPVAPRKSSRGAKESRSRRTDESQILVSARVVDGESLAAYVRAFAGRSLQTPLRNYTRPAAEFLRRLREKMFVVPAI